MGVFARSYELPFIMVLFGGTGDLARRKVIPSLYSLYEHGYLPDVFQIIAPGRRASSQEAFYAAVREFLPQSAKVEEFLKHFEYIRMDLRDLDSFVALRDHIRTLEETTHKACVSKLYYMALTPDVLPIAIEHLGKVGLHIGCGEEANKWSRIIVEKPFGHDLASAKSLNSLLLEYFKEEQIYRIDHYLGKELVQTILSVRFANAMFYPLLNKNYIERIEIVATETLGMEGRGAFYDQTGALRDFVQSHLLQIVALAMMSEPKSFDAKILRDAKSEVLQNLRLFDEQTICTDMWHAQYRGYRAEEKVHPQSLTETYVAFKTFVDLPEWYNVPIFVRHGKALNQKETAIHFVFKPHASQLYASANSKLRDDVGENILSILLAPEEGYRVRTNIKAIGFGTGLHRVDLRYAFSETEGNVPDAYERLLLDCIQGDQSLFLRSDEIEASWRWIDRIFDLWQKTQPELYFYYVGESLTEKLER